VVFTDGKIRRFLDAVEVSLKNPPRWIRMVEALNTVLRPQNAILSANCSFVNGSRK
jgi:hypothetical protein